MANHRTKLGWGALIGLGALLLTGCGVIVAIATLMFGRVSGSEFNPHTFERRTFLYHEIPLLRIQVTPLSRDSADGDLEQLVQTKYLQPKPTGPGVWHLIAYKRVSQAAQTTDVQILAYYLEARNEDNTSYWHVWSQKHPELAALLWPEVIRLTQLELYTLIPSLFDLARNSDDTISFRDALRTLQISQLRDQAARYTARAEKQNEEDAKTSFEERATNLNTAADAVETALKSAS